MIRKIRSRSFRSANSTTNFPFLFGTMSIATRVPRTSARICSNSTSPTGRSARCVEGTTADEDLPALVLPLVRIRTASSTARTDNPSTTERRARAS